MDTKMQALEEVYAYAQRAKELGIPLGAVAGLRKMETEERWTLVEQGYCYPDQVWWVFTSWEIAHKNGLSTPYDWDGYSSSRHPSRSDYIWGEGRITGEQALREALEKGLVPVKHVLVTDELPPAKRPNAKEIAREWAQKHIGRRKPHS